MAFSRRSVRIWALALVPLAILATGFAGWALKNRAAPVDQQRPGPVLLVTGYGGGTGGLEQLAGRLRAAGRQAVLVPATGDNTGDLRGQARTLAAVAREQLKAGAPSVDVVGYSAGGVVTRIWAAELGGAAVARRIVTLGSPHHGTDVAGAAAALLGGCPTACEQLVPGSDLLRNLPETPDGPRWTSIWTANDETVTPPATATLAGATDLELQSACPSAQVSHGQLPTDPRVAALTIEALGPGLPSPTPCPADQKQ